MGDEAAGEFLDVRGIRAKGLGKGTRRVRIEHDDPPNPTLPQVDHLDGQLQMEGRVGLRRKYLEKTLQDRETNIGQGQDSGGGGRFEPPAKGVEDAVVQEKVSEVLPKY